MPNANRYQCYCSYCGSPMEMGETVYWSHQKPHCSKSCSEQDGDSRLTAMESLIAQRDTALGELKVKVQGCEILRASLQAANKDKRDLQWQLDHSPDHQAISEARVEAMKLRAQLKALP